MMVKNGGGRLSAWPPVAGWVVVLVGASPPGPLSRGEGEPDDFGEGNRGSVAVLEVAGIMEHVAQGGGACGLLASSDAGVAGLA